jgi:hypothetical protein
MPVHSISPSGAETDPGRLQVPVLLDPFASRGRPGGFIERDSSQGTRGSVSTHTDFDPFAGLNRQFNCRSFSKPECGTPFAPFLQIFVGVRHDDVRRSQHANSRQQKVFRWRRRIAHPNQ